MDSTNPWKNYMQVMEDSTDFGRRLSKKKLLSMVDFSVRISNISQNILLILEVAFGTAYAYSWKKEDNPDY